MQRVKLSVNYFGGMLHFWNAMCCWNSQKLYPSYQSMWGHRPSHKHMRSFIAFNISEMVQNNFYSWWFYVPTYGLHQSVKIKWGGNRKPLVLCLLLKITVVLESHFWPEEQVHLFFLCIEWFSLIKQLAGQGLNNKFSLKEMFPNIVLVCVCVCVCVCLCA